MQTERPTRTSSSEWPEAGREQFMEAVGLTRRQRKPGRKGKPTCADCFFHRRLLCALDLESPCSTFRADSPGGLVPPRQPALLVRQPPVA